MSLAATIREKLASLNPTHLDVINESYKHAGPKDAETHFKLIIVSSEFEKKPPIQRHRMVNQLLDHELKTEGLIHALSLQTKTPAQWEKDQTIHETPNCQGGSGKA